MFLMKARRNAKKIFEEERKEVLKMAEEEEKKCLIEDESRRRVLKKMRVAKIEDYRKWLRRYLIFEMPSDFCDYEFEDADFYVAKEDLFLPALYGATSINLIVPRGVKVEYEKLGHNNIYFMKGFKNVGEFVPFYNDL